MGFGTLNPKAYDEDIGRRASAPAAPEEASFSLWSFGKALAGAPPRALFEVAGSVRDFSRSIDLRTQEQENFRASLSGRMPRQVGIMEGGASARAKADQLFAPDPETAHTADVVVHDLGRFVTKVVGGVVVGGPFAAAGLVGLEEGNTTARRLIEEKGVDPDTAAKVGAAVGVASAVSIALPAGGATWARSLGIAALGGPATFMAQESIARKVLQDAGYKDEAGRHDPTDPLGLALSIIPSAAVAGLHMRGVAKRAKAIEGAPLDQMPLPDRQKLKYSDPKFDAYTEQAATRAGVPPEILLAIKNAGERSGPTATSPKGAQGVMQFMPETAREMGVFDPNDPVQAIDGAARYMRRLFDQYGSWDAAVAHYNGGGKVAADVLAGKTPRYAETAAYLDRVRKYVAENTATKGAAREAEAIGRAADDPEVVAAARVQVLEEVSARNLPDAPGARADVARAADELGAGRMPMVEAWDAPRVPARTPEFAEIADDLRGMGTAAYWAQEGGSIVRSGRAEPGDGGMGGEVVGRTTWIPAEEWFGRMRGDLGRDGLSKQADIQEAIEAAIRGDKLKAKQARTVEWIRNEVIAMREEAQRVKYEWDDPDLIARDAFDAGLSSRDMADAAMVSRAAEIDEAAVERLAIAHDGDDAAFMAGIREILGNEQVTETQQPHSRVIARGEETPTAPAVESAAVRPAAAEPAQSLDAQRLAKLEAENPDMRVILPGETEPMTLADALRKARDTADDEASFADLVRVAAECALTAG